jgi:hypothetical protein
MDKIVGIMENSNALYDPNSARYDEMYEEE